VAFVVEGRKGEGANGSANRPLTLRRVYLVDRDIRGLLGELEIHTPDADHSFDADEQIQPCSIDVRLSPVFWEASRRRRLWRLVLRLGQRTVDLRRPDFHAIAPLRDWKKLELREGETLTIKPGQTVMGRIYERFRIPPGYAGKVEGRSAHADPFVR
jgi:deoxycytidine triphosphate deaminase